VESDVTEYQGEAAIVGDREEGKRVGITEGAGDIVGVNEIDGAAVGAIEIDG
jgi:hypothetical protein